VEKAVLDYLNSDVAKQAAALQEIRRVASYLLTICDLPRGVFSKRFPKTEWKTLSKNKLV